MVEYRAYRDATPVIELDLQMRRRLRLTRAESLSTTKCITWSGWFQDNLTVFVPPKIITEDGI
jgi:hypothetical protein